MNRRKFITKSIGGIGLAASIQSASAARHRPGSNRLKETDRPFAISIFSKNLQWLDYDGMASTAAQLGFDGVDLTVRPGGHVEPARVAEDLPRAFEAVKKAGLNIYSIVTAIEDADHAHTEPILRAARDLKISHYRLGWFHYDPSKSITDNINAVQERVRKLEALNARYEISGSYQNHSGHYFGAPVWDLAQVLKAINAKWTGSQYDIYHATIEGSSSWIYGFELIAPFIKTINIKDFAWTKKDGKWSAESVPLGDGAVDFDSYFSLLKKINVNCPLSVHYEYPLGTADQGGRTLTVKKDVVLRAMKKDLDFLTSKLKSNSLR
jgi:L-ribulose-5-phosphate 3-epimerase